MSALGRRLRRLTPKGQRRIRAAARGRAAYDAGDWAAAEAAFDEALALTPGDTALLLSLARTRRNRDDLAGALDAARDAAAADPAQALALLNDVAARALREGQPEVTVDATGMLAGRDDARAVDLRLRALHAVGRVDEADALAARIAQRPVVPAALAVAVARHQLAADRPADAAALLAGAADAEGLALLAQARMKQGRLADAAAAAEQALTADPEHADARRWLTAATGYQRAVAEGWLPAVGDTAALEPVPGRVLHLLLRSLPYYLSGYTVRSQAIVTAQRQIGLDPVVCTQLGFPAEIGVTDAADVEDVAGVAHHRLADRDEPAPGLDERLEQYATAAAGVVERVRPALLHPASNFKNGLVALALGRRYGLPVVYEVRGFQEDSWQSRMAGADDGGGVPADSYLGRRAVEARCMASADHVVTLAEVMRDEIVAQGVAVERVSVVPNAVDATVFQPVERDPALAASYGIDADAVTVGYISTFAAFEGIDSLLRAVAELAGRGHRVTTVLVGDDARTSPGQRAALERLAAELGVADQVVFTGRVPHDDILRYYGLIDVFVVPRTDERVCHLVTPLKPLEALATARTVVVSRVRALAEIVHEGETGLAFTPEDPVDLADVVEPLLDDPGLRAQLGAAGRAWVASERTWTRNAERYRAIYAQLGAC